jgi:hypothetical protein
MKRLIETIRQLLHIRVPVSDPNDALVIDQGIYFDVLQRRQQRWREDEEEEGRQRQRIAYMVWDWARDVVRYRCKRPLPAKLPRAGVVREWLDGLHVQEIFALAQADGFSIMHHIYSDIRIDGVRRVQPLPVAELRFPVPKIAQDDVGRAGAGGGPRKPI